MTKYIAIIDHKAETKLGFTHVELKAKTILEAMNEAEKFFSTEQVYLVDIAEKFGKTERVNDYKETKFAAVLRNRGGGWHCCDEQHGESKAVWNMCQTKNVTFFEISM